MSDQYFDNNGLSSRMQCMSQTYSKDPAEAPPPSPPSMSSSFEDDDDAG